MLTTHTAVITGGGSGLGRAMAIILAKKGHDVFIIGRRAEKLDETSSQNPEKIHSIVADVSTEEGRNTIKLKLNRAKIKYLIHNAGIVKPLKPLLETTIAEFRQTLATNLEAPIFLTQTLLPLIPKNSRILHISTGAAHNPLPGMGVYAISKAGLLMAYKVYKQELLEKEIYVGSIQPGVVDTEMQSVLRNPDHKEKFSSHEIFKDMHTNQKLISAEDSANQIIDYLLNQSNTDFIETDSRVASE